MDCFDDIHSELNSSPLRRNATFRVRQLSDGRREEQLLGGEVISMSGDGSIDRAVVSVAHSYHCGHPATDPIGCACAEPGCDNLSCKECSKDAHCARCLKPLCLEHLQKLELPAGTVNLCGRCKVELVRKERWRVFRTVLKLFVDFESRK